MPLVLLQHLLNVHVQLANKRGLKKFFISFCVALGFWRGDSNVVMVATIRLRTFSLLQFQAVESVCKRRMHFCNSLLQALDDGILNQN
jgi:hypothetical protein